MNKIFLLIILVTFCLQCKSQEYYPQTNTIRRVNSYLWRATEIPWAWRNSLDRVKELIEKKGAKVDYIDQDASSDTTPFLNAAGALQCLKRKEYRSDGELDSMEIEAVKIVKYLAKKGANIQVTSTSRKLNALHLAACGGREKMIPVLVNLGLDINSTDSLGGTSLLHAIAAGDLATVKAVVKAGADINKSTPDGNSPLDWAQAYLRIKGRTFAMPYDDQEAIAEYMQSIEAKHGKNEFTGMLYFDESKK